MRELKRQGVAVIYISHHLEEIFQVCDRISVLRDADANVVPSPMWPATAISTAWWK